MSENPGTSQPSADDVMNATAVPILEFGRAWMQAPETVERATELGLDGPLGFWTVGRAGILGEADADVAAAAIGFMAPGRVRHHWEHRPAETSAAAVAAEYAGCAAAFGRRVLASMPDANLVELTALCDVVADAALPSTGALFAGWRNLDRPQDPAGAATVALNVIRELRGGAHLSAVHAVGIGPHGAIMAAPDPVRGGAAGAGRFGWTEPHPEADFERREQAERLTSDICRPAFQALDNGQRVRFIELVATARATLAD